MTTPTEALLHLARRYQSFVKPDYPYKKMLRKLESKEIAPNEYLKLKNRVISRAKRYMKEVR